MFEQTFRNLDEVFAAIATATAQPLTTDQRAALHTRTLYGKEKKSLAYVIGVMNLILHGVEAPNIAHTNTLAENLADIQERDRFDLILANPPFGGKERKEVQQNFPIKTGETAAILDEIAALFLGPPSPSSAAFRREAGGGEVGKRKRPSWGSAGPAGRKKPSWGSAGPGGNGAAGDICRIGTR